MVESIKVKRGEIYDVDWGGDAGLHPALIIQNDIGNQHSSATIVAYITHTVKNLPVLVNFKDHESGLGHGGSVDLGRIMTIPKSMLKDKRGHLSSSKMPQVNQAIQASLGID
ncbi:type II toxin-antitoxin system PemK/MazF family toxin [Chloroflexota bacterium]